MSEPTEREDYEQLVTSPGWLRFAEFAKKQWGPVGYGQRLKQAIADAKRAGIDLSEAVARVDAASDAVNELLTWPKTRAADLLSQEANRKRETEPPLSRRGTL
jgi:hypothetical protein